jgi:hypothetical protein
VLEIKLVESLISIFPAVPAVEGIVGVDQEGAAFDPERSTLFAVAVAESIAIADAVE